MKGLKIAIVGAGTAGLAAAAFLQGSGHAVTLFERFDAPKPLGAGLLIQPTGLAVLSLLGLDKKNHRKLSRCIDQAASTEEAFATYGKLRRNHLAFYQTASRTLTPFFQSDSWLFARLRFLTCGIACRIPFTRRIAAEVLTGTKTGPFSRLNPDEMAADYDLLKAASNALIE